MKQHLATIGIELLRHTQHTSDFLVEFRVFLAESHKEAADRFGVIRDMKAASTSWTRTNGVFRGFPGSQDGYSAFTKSHADRDAVIAHIQRQAEHHRHESFIDEKMRLLHEEGVAFDEKYLE